MGQSRRATIHSRSLANDAPSTSVLTVERTIRGYDIRHGLPLQFPDLSAVSDAEILASTSAHRCFPRGVESFIVSSPVSLRQTIAAYERVVAVLRAAEQAGPVPGSADACTGARYLLRPGTLDRVDFPMPIGVIHLRSNTEADAAFSTPAAADAGRGGTLACDRRRRRRPDAVAAGAGDALMAPGPGGAARQSLDVVAAGAAASMTDPGTHS